MNRENMRMVAAAASVVLSGIDELEGIEASQDIIELAPEHLQDDFAKCCAYFIYRDLLIKASEDNSLDIILSAQSHLMSFLDA